MYKDLEKFDKVDWINLSLSIMMSLDDKSITSHKVARTSGMVYQSSESVMLFSCTS